jgi:hypothetical protein
VALEPAPNNATKAAIETLMLLRLILLTGLPPCSLHCSTSIWPTSDAPAHAIEHGGAPILPFTDNCILGGEWETRA